MPEPHVHRLRVRYGECDALGMVFNANYLAYLDVSLVELNRAAFGSHRRLNEAGLDTVVAEARLQFVAPARFDDELEIAAAVTHLGTTSMAVSHVMTRPADGATIARAEMRHVWVGVETGAKTPIPDWVREGLAPFLVSAEAEASLGRR